MGLRKKSKAKEGGAPPKDLTPQAAGQRVGSIYHQAMASLAKLVKDNPKATAIKQGVLALKEQTIRELVAIGKLREGMNPEGKKQVELTAGLLVGQVSMVDWNACKDACEFYANEDNAFSQVLASFNTITQYAFYELLKKQLPQEAARLGIA